MRTLSFIDRLICELDAGLRTAFATSHADRPMPTGDVGTLTPEQSAESIRLMRVNHTGEVCAQALYQGQALVAKSAATREFLLHAAREERDHLAWCDRRLDQLGGATSVLNPLFYAGAFAFGAASGLLADKWSLGFLVETERQVEAHLTDHLGRIAEPDTQSRAVINAMRDDEIRHGQSASASGAGELPPSIQHAMRLASKAMTRTAYWI